MGVVPELGEMESHLPPSLVETVPVQPTAPPWESSTSRVCAAGLAPPASAENASEAGETSSTAVTSKLTGTTVGLPPDAATDTSPL